MSVADRVLGRLALSEDERQLRTRERVIYLLEKVGTILTAAVLLVVFSLTASVFLTEANIDNILIQIAVVGVVALGETFVMLLRGIDLSVGSVTLFSAVVVGILNVSHHAPAGLAIAVALLLCFLIGALNGVLVALVRIEPIIVTLGTSLAVSGLDQHLLAQNGSWIQINDPLFVNMVISKLWVLPVMAVILFALYALGAFILRKTPFGRDVYAIGGNPRAADLAGIRSSAVIVSAYAICGLCAGIGGVLIAAQVGTISQAVGGDLLFSAITVVVVGGLSLAGGAGSVWRTLIGAFIFGMIYNYLTLQNFSIYYQQAIAGFLILGAAVLVQLARISGER